MYDVMISMFPSRGLYLTSIFYRDDNILVTSEDQIPIVEVEDSFSVSLMQDFLWFTKVDTRPYNHRTTATTNFQTLGGIDNNLKKRNNMLKTNTST